ncbi:hypothetical protein Lfu02_67860 [Longispora fulva]|nr:hypothetical protein Lfu02_67860 [Longispora fulva]
MTGVLTPPGAIAIHHGRHDELLNTVVQLEQAPPVHAIIVPTSRPVHHLDHAMRLADSLDCWLLALCSQQADAALTRRRAEEHRVRVIAVDVPATPQLPQLQTDRVLVDAGLHRRADTSAKRNLGLTLGRMLGWERAMFLDDDIVVGSAADILEAAAHVPSYAAVGLTNAGQHDNSVVCHAHRLTGGEQACFIGGGALAVSPSHTRSFFPAIYNEDWFFLLDDVGLGRIGVTKGQAKQQPYDPFADPARARAEEFGDLLAEGLFALLDDGRGVRDADLAYWRRYRDIRNRFIRDILARAGGVHRQQMRASLNAALDQLETITPELCVKYLEAWRVDRTVWAEHMDNLTLGLQPHEALASLGLPPQIAHAAGGVTLLR